MDDQLGPIVEAALELRAAGIVPLRPKEDGSKSPSEGRGWEKTPMPTAEEVYAKFNGAAGVAGLMGSVSGNTVLFEFEGIAVSDGLWEQYEQAVMAKSKALYATWLRIRTCYQDESPRGGKRVMWRVSDGPVAGSVKLASRRARPDEYNDDEKIRVAANPRIKVVRTLIETRGEGGQVVLPPSGGGVHPNGKSWRIASGSFGQRASVTTQHTKQLFDIARTFNQLQTNYDSRLHGRRTAAEEQWEVGQDWEEILGRWGWTIERVRDEDGVAYVRHPGITRGHGATLQPGPNGKLYVFSTSTEFEAERYYSKAEFLAVVEHDGNIAEAKRALGITRDRPEIWLDNRNEYDIAEEIVTRLEQANVEKPRLFAHGQIGVVKVGEELKELTKHSLALESGQIIDFKKTVGSGESQREAMTEGPRNTMAGIIDGGMLSGLPPLQTISEVPFYTPSGTLWQTPGYCREAETFYEPGDFRIGRIPDNPTQDQIGKAKRLIEYMLIDFPFATESDRGAAWSLMVLPLIRRLVRGPVPLYDVEAPIRGTGKGKLVHALLYPTQGHLSPQSIQKNDEETLKVLIASLLSGSQVVVFDNVNESLSSGELSAVLTSWPYFKGRILGESRIAKMRSECIYVSTGNNPQFSSEVLRRVARIRLDAGVEHPDRDRTFHEADLNAWVIQNRKGILEAIYILINGWLSDGAPKAKRILASFESWSAAAGGFCEWIGLGDPIGDRESFAEASDEEVAWSTLVELWAEKVKQPGSLGQSWSMRTAGELVALIDQNEVPIFCGGKTDMGRAKSLGKQLAKKRDMVIAGHKIVAVRTASSNAYSLVKAPEQQ